MQTNHSTPPSKNSIAQAIKILRPDLKKAQFFSALRIPATRLTTARYWEESYNILPWSKRTEDEKAAALQAAKSII